MSSPTPLSIPTALEKFVPELAKAAEKAKGSSEGSSAGASSAE
ncbi:hypothetical protein [Kytococcus schroeteri]|nr:hypothetical protein [Kytococcus schroeteri]